MSTTVAEVTIERPLDASTRGGWRAALLGVWRNRVAAASAFILLVYLFTAAFGHWFSPYDPYAMHVTDRFSAPTLTYLFGTDELGRDLFSRVINGTRITVLVGFGSVILSVLTGLPLGFVAGMRGRAVDDAIMRFLDGLLAFPTIILALAMVAVFGPGARNVLIAIGVVLTPTMARITRAAVLTQRELDYVTAARAVGASGWRVAVRSILPNCLSPVVVQASLSIAVAIKVEASLSFLGVGTQVPDASWGFLLSEGFRNLDRAPWLAIFPGINIVLIVLSLNLLGDGLRDALEPRMR